MRFCSVLAKHVCAAAVLCACCYTLLCLMHTDYPAAWPSKLGRGIPDAHLADSSTSKSRRRHAVNVLSKPDSLAKQTIAGWRQQQHISDTALGTVCDPAQQVIDCKHTRVMTQLQTSYSLHGGHQIGRRQGGVPADHQPINQSVNLHFLSAGLTRRIKSHRLGKFLGHYG